MGPLELAVSAPDEPIAQLIEATLGLYDVVWPVAGPAWPISVSAAMAERPDETPAVGRYLVLSQMTVDTVDAGLYATTATGASGEGSFLERGEDWTLHIPRAFVGTDRWFEVEDLLTLIIATGWRRAGWVPLHAAGLVRGGRGIIAGASSGGGKTSFAVAMARRGWRVLGDDKLLLGRIEGESAIVGLLHWLNLDPATAAWFPEIGDLSRAARYSVMTPKRRIALTDLWPDALATSAAPTDVIVLERMVGARGVTIQPMDGGETLATLLRQTVIPTEVTVARSILATVSSAARGCRGWHVTVGDDAYRDPGALDAVEAALG